jgi:hypothetical protein
MSCLVCHLAMTLEFNLEFMPLWILDFSLFHTNLRSLKFTDSQPWVFPDPKLPYSPSQQQLGNVRGPPSVQ